MKVMRLSGDMLPYLVDLLADRDSMRGYLLQVCLSHSISEVYKAKQFLLCSKKILHNSGYDLRRNLISQV